MTTLPDPIPAKFAAVIEHMQAQDYVAAIAHLRWLDGLEGKWKYVHQYRNAINRIEVVFLQTFSRQPWPKDWQSNVRMQWENEVGYYIHRLGVGALVDDMRQARERRLEPKTLIYFLRSHDQHGQQRSSRWEMLLYGMMDEEWQEAKRREAQEVAQAAREGRIPEAVTPVWVTEARANLKALRSKSYPTADDVRAIHHLEAQLSNHGYCYAA
ncbi:MAG: hypothetical protein ACETWG_05690 [Candidatus Neomarinimicrobiota bacterium]